MVQWPTLEGVGGYGRLSSSCGRQREIANEKRGQLEKELNLSSLEICMPSLMRIKRVKNTVAVSSQYRYWAKLITHYTGVAT